ncbi:MAG: hypothetical protein AAGD38_00415 [Acidobacteriota bacterium]
MIRFLALAFPILLLLFAFFGFVVDLSGLDVETGTIPRLGAPIDGQIVIGSWLLEAVGLIALFLLLQGRSGTWWLDGLVTGWIAWIFRGPLLVITIVLAARQPHEPWWQLALGWFGLYTACGLVLAMLGRPMTKRATASAATVAATSITTPPDSHLDDAMASTPSELTIDTHDEDEAGEDENSDEGDDDGRRYDNVPPAPTVSTPTPATTSRVTRSTGHDDSDDDDPTDD